jgi:3-oxoadipate enol-lactonase
LSRVRGPEPFHHLRRKFISFPASPEVMPSASRSGLVNVAGGQLFFEVAGKGPAIVFVHAAIADRRMWNREFDLFSKGATAIRYDVRGFGRSPAATASYSNVEDLSELLKHLGVTSVTLVGCSNGGRIAIDFAVEHPKSVNGLLLLSPGLGGWGPQYDPAGQAVYDEDMARSGKIMEDWKAGREQQALEGLYRYWTSAQSGPNRELVRRMMSDNVQEIFTDASASHATGPEPPAVGRLGSITAPTLVLYGDHDEPTMDYICRNIVRGIPGSRFVPVPGADHLINLSRPKEFDASLKELLAPKR